MIIFEVTPKELETELMEPGNRSGLALEIRATALGLNEKCALQQALHKLVNRAQRENADSLEVTRIEITKVLAFFYARLRGRLRQFHDGQLLFQTAEAMRRRSLGLVE